MKVLRWGGREGDVHVHIPTGAGRFKVIIRELFPTADQVWCSGKW